MVVAGVEMSGRTSPKIIQKHDVILTMLRPERRHPSHNGNASTAKMLQKAALKSLKTKAR
jgi:hypothetical protein